MEQISDKFGLPLIVAILAAFVLLYSLWGASLLRQQQDLSQNTSTTFVAVK